MYRPAGGPIQNDSGLPQKCRTQACTSTYAVKCSHLAPLATKGLFGKCQNRADARSRHNAFVLLAGRSPKRPRRFCERVSRAFRRGLEIETAAARAAPTERLTA